MEVVNSVADDTRVEAVEAAEILVVVFVVDTVVVDDSKLLEGIVDNVAIVGSVVGPVVGSFVGSVVVGSVVGPVVVVRCQDWQLWVGIKFYIAKTPSRHVK